MILSEAFKQLDMLTEETFSIDPDGLEELKDFEEKDEVIETEDIIDPKAETEEELEDSYVGKVILDCCVCHSKLYKDAEEVVLSEDETVANADEECPFCYSTDGFKVIGQVSEFEEESKEEEESDAPDTEETIEVKEEDKKENTEEITEGIFGDKYKGKTILLYNNKPIAIADSKAVDNLIKFENAHMKQTGADESEYNTASGRGAAKRFKGLKSVPDVTKSLPYWVIQSGEEDVKKRSRQQRQEDARQAAERNEVSRKLAAYDANKKDKPVKRIGSSSGTPGIDYRGGDYVPKDESYDGSKSIKESINNLSLDTEDTHMEMTSEDNGKVTITTEPINNAPEEGEFIAPLEDETKMEIEANSDEEPVGEEEGVSADVEEFDEESFDNLGESYLKKVYDNVESFKTTSVGATPKKLVVEGLIKFSSGKSKKTSFIFESKTITKSGKVKFIGENKEITPRKNAFVVKGQLKGTKLLSESLTYNYRAKDNKGKSSRLYGTVKVGK